MSEKRQDFMKNYDWIRQGLMFEPRGHDMMSGAIFYPPQDPANDVAILFIETSGCLPMCGHGTIGAITIGIEKQIFIPKTPGHVRLETPAGLVKVSYELENDRVSWVRFLNVPSFLCAQGLQVTSQKFGSLTFDVAYGGNFYAIIDQQENFTGLEGKSAGLLIEAGREIRDLINAKYPNQFIHPEDETILGLSHILWTGTPSSENITAKNAVIYGDKAIDRSPCGTGTSARMAQWHAKGWLQPGEPFIHESIIGSVFDGRIEETTRVGEYAAVIPSIKGWARIYGENIITIDDDDPFAHGFQVV